MRLAIAASFLFGCGGGGFVKLVLFCFVVWLVVVVLVDRVCLVILPISAFWGG
jgi:hypothetical protein